MKTIWAFYSLRHFSGRENFGGVLDYLGSRRDWDIRVYDAKADFTVSRMRQAADGAADGVILSEPGSAAAMEALSRAAIPVALVNIPDESIPVPFRSAIRIWTDDAAIGATAAQYLLSRGNFNSFGFVHKKEVTFWSRKREAGFRAGLVARGRGGDYREFAHEGADTEARRRLRDWLIALPKPAAVMAATDRRAVHVLETCTSADLHVPDQVSIIGVDNDEAFAESVSPRLSSVAQNQRELGRRTAEALTRLIESRWRRGVADILVPVSEIVERESTAPVIPATMLIKRARKFIAAHYAEGISVDDVVRHLGCSRRLADLRFRQIEKVTVKTALTNERLMHVRKLLASSSLSAKLIARRCGFASPSQLSHVFRSRFGKSIRDWRAEAAGGVPPVP